MTIGLIEYTPATKNRFHNQLKILIFLLYLQSLPFKNDPNLQPLDFSQNVNFELQLHFLYFQSLPVKNNPNLPFCGFLQSFNFELQLLLDFFNFKMTKLLKCDLQPFSPFHLKYFHFNTLCLVETWGAVVYTTSTVWLCFNWPESTYLYHSLAKIHRQAEFSLSRFEEQRHDPGYRRNLPGYRYLIN